MGMSWFRKSFQSLPSTYVRDAIKHADWVFGLTYGNMLCTGFLHMY